MKRAILVVLGLGLGCDGGGPSGMMVPPTFMSNCTPATVSADAKLPPGPQSDGSVILLGGRRISPVGKLLDVGGFPLAMRVLPGDRYVVVTDGAYGDEKLRIVDLQASDPHNAVVSSIDYPIPHDADPHAGALFYGLALTADGKRIYVSNGGFDPVPDATPMAQHYNTIQVFDLVGAPPQLVENTALELRLYFNAGSSTNGAAAERYPAGIALSSDEQTLYVATQNDGTLAILDLRTGANYGVEIGRAALPGVGPYDVALDEAAHLAYVSMWGGEKAGATTFTDGVAVVDVTDPTMPAARPMLIETGKAAEAEILRQGKLLVANADADTISTIDLSSDMAVATPIAAGAILGRSPNALAVDESAGRLYVANAGDDSVSAFDVASMMPLGRLPTAWYPTVVATLSDGTLLVASAKGLGLGPTNHGRGFNDYMQGVLQIIPMPSPSDLMAGDQQVTSNLARPASYEPLPSCPSSGERRFPLPPQAGDPTPIQHVFLIVRENKTYDADLGDLAGSNGDPSLVLFGADVTPNLHALAETFTNLDNFYSNADQSLQGHEWTTAGIANDYTEKGWLTTWGRYTRPFTAFGSGYYEHLAHPGTDTIWTHLDKAALPYHNYGEAVNTFGAKTLNDPSFPGFIFDIDIPDVDKMAYVVDNMFNAPISPVEPFVYIGLPDDHTYGTRAGKPTPQSMVADNDEATGRFVDALSHSDLWPSSIVFIIEDDPSDGADHVEAHRSPCVVVSPWVKRGYVSSVNRDNPAMMKTILRLLGQPAMNVNDANAAAFYDVFSTTPDATPYTFIPRKVPAGTNSDDAPLSDESARIDFSRPDSAPLGRILWKAMRGKDAEPPWGPTDSPLPQALREHDDDDD